MLQYRLQGIFGAPEIELARLSAGRDQINLLEVWL